MVLVTTQFLYQILMIKLLARCQNQKKILLDHRFLAFKKLKKKVKTL